MSHDAQGRGRTNSTTAANGQFKPPPSNGDNGSMAASAVEETGTQSSVDMSIETTHDYSMDSTNKSVTNSLPPRIANSSYGQRTIAETRDNQITKEHPPLLEPPVTKTTLSELDVNKIVHNPKLRHDVNFDPDLHFRPNLDGERGRRKSQKADKFWETMRIQLRDYLMNREQFEKDLGGAEWCLPATLKAIKGILETLVPQRDRSSVEETFNTDLLMQQFRKGVADLPKLATWLSQLLKCHCAPMRDSWVDGMVTEISKGDQEGDVALLVLGMRNLLGVLEAMKLDVANHQIRCLRPLLIEDTVHFEQKFFMKKIAMKRIDIVGAHLWFRRASSIPDIGPITQSTGNFWDFMKALVNLTLKSKSEEKVPHTFLFDEERLIKLRSDMEDLINFEICMHTFRDLGAIYKTQLTPHDDTPVMSTIPSPCSRPASPADITLRTSPTQLPLPHHFAPKSKPGAIERGHFRRAPSGQQLWVPTLENEINTSSAISSPRSSPSSTASTPDTYPPRPLYLSLPSIDADSRLRFALHAILTSSNTPDRWCSLAPSLALEILRSTTIPLTELPRIESRLASHLSKPHSRVYQKAENRVLSQLFPVLRNLVGTYTPLTSLQIFEAATTPKSLPESGVSGVKEDIDEIATRIAHIGTLHWRIWAPLAYLVDPDEQQEILMERPKSMP